MSDVSESELGKKGSQLTQQTMGRVSEQAEELSKTDVGQAVQKVCVCVCVCSELNAIGILPLPLRPREPAQ